MCTQGYQLNLEDKERTAAYCNCENGKCAWKFNKLGFKKINFFIRISCYFLLSNISQLKSLQKGDIKCVKCPKPTGSKIKGKGIMDVYGNKAVTVR